jgi:hypothetical protein
MNQFAEKYNRFTEMLQEGQFDIKRAKELSRSWRRVEDCGMWPKPKGKT